MNLLYRDPEKPAQVRADRIQRADAIKISSGQRARNRWAR